MRVEGFSRSLALEVARVGIRVRLAETVWRAANDRTGQVRFPAGPDAVAQWEASR